MTTLFRQQLVELVAAQLAGHSRVRLGGWRVMGHVPEAHRTPLVNLARGEGVALRASDFVGWHLLKHAKPGRAAAAAALLGLLLASTAEAETIGEVPGDRSTTAVVLAGGDRWHQSRFERAGDADWFRVQLQARGHYGLGFADQSADVGAWLSFGIRDQAGRLLAGDVLDRPPPYEGQSATLGGVEFVAPYSGWYYVSTKALAGPGYYVFTIRHDCDDGPTSPCRLAVGGTTTDVHQWWDDRDWYRVDLPPGGTYALTAPYCGPTASVALVAPDGAETDLGEVPNGCQERLDVTVGPAGAAWLAVGEGSSNYALRLDAR